MLALLSHAPGQQNNWAKIKWGIEQTFGSMLWEPEPAKAAPLILKTTLRHLGLVTGFVFILVIWPLGLEVAVPYLQTYMYLNEFKFNSLIKQIYYKRYITKSNTTVLQFNLTNNL